MSGPPLARSPEGAAPADRQAPGSSGSTTEPAPPAAGAPATEVSVTVRYFAAARAAAGADEQSLLLPAPATVAAAIEAIGEQHGDALARVLKRCSFLLGGVAVRDPSGPLHSGDELDVLPPFAGG